MMSNEEFDRKMEFLLNQQARFDARFEADMQALREAQKETDEKVKHMFDGFDEAKQLTIQTREDLAELTTLTTEGFKLLYEQSRNTDARIAALVKAQIETEVMFRSTDAMIRNIGVKFEHHLKENHNSG